MKTLNIGVLAHVDAGKTSLTERLLYNNGVIQTLGSVDKGNTQTDSMALERQRGITIKSAVTSFTLDDLKINILDTPGHPDFIAEVERVLRVLDGAVLVISVVEGVQAQTKILMRALQRLNVPTIIFVNKIDRMGARYDELLKEISLKLAPDSIAIGTVRSLGTKDAKFILSDSDQSLGAESPNPVYFGSAITNAGVEALTDTFKAFKLPKSYPDKPVSGLVFKVERGKSDEKIAYVRLFAGTLNVRDQLPSGKITALSIFDNGSVLSTKSVSAGDIAKITGLSTVKVGDTIGAEPSSLDNYHFAPPTLETVITPINEVDKGRLHTALDQLAEQDPLINLRQDDVRQEVSLSLYGEVQKEVIQDTLYNDYSIEVEFKETTTICVERLLGSGSAVEFQPKTRVGAPEFDEKINQFLATVGLKVEPAELNGKVEFTIASEASGKMPAAFYKAVEETVLETLNQGVYGWRVTDCRVSLTHAGFWPRQSSAHGGFDKNISSTARDFRYLTPLVLMDALRGAGVVVCEPIHRFRLEVPNQALDTVIRVLSKINASPMLTEKVGDSYVIKGEIPIESVHALQQKLPSLTSGEGVLESSFEGYQPVSGGPPRRPRTDFNPLNRREYLLNIAKKG